MKAKLPFKSVEILGQKVKIVYKKFPEEDKEWAHYKYSSHTIYLSVELQTHPMEFQLFCLIHEMGHALISRLNLEMDDKIEEILVDCYGKMLTENFTIK